ncbi:MFS transporter [Nanoarchaeota archaeon]
MLHNHNQHIPHPHLLNFLKDKMNEIYVVHSMDAFVMALFGIFVPIYLLKLGFSLPQVIGFFLLHVIIAPIFSFISGFISNRIGLKHTMLLRFPFIFGYLLMLYSLDTIAIPLSLIVIVGSFGTSLYWMPMLSLFARHASKKHMGRDFGVLSSVVLVAHAIAPFIGGVIATFFGFNSLFIVAMVLLALSVIPLFYTPEIKAHVKFKIEDGLKIYKENIKLFTGLAFNHVRGMCELVIWPIFVYLVLKNVMSVGIVGFLLGITMAVLTLVVGRLSDNHSKRRFIRAGAFFAIIFWILRYYISSATSVYLITILIAFATIFVSTPFASILYKRAKKYNIDEFIILREIPISIARALILSAALILVNKIELTFIVTAISQIFFLFF